MKKQLRYNYDVLTYVLNFSITYVLNPYTSARICYPGTMLHSAPYLMKTSPSLI